MPTRTPLTAHAPGDVIAWLGNGRAVSAGRFAAEVRQVAAALPAGPRFVLNVCQDRYRFMVGFGAALLAGRTTLMPSSFAPDTVAQLGASHGDILGLHDGAQRPDGLDAFELSVALLDAAPDTAPVPAIDDNAVAAIVFTSGSTGTPTPHQKTWGRLAINGAGEAERLGAAGIAIVATVPPQHMYGFESSVLMALHGGATLWHGRPFYPADVAAALAAVPAPRMLVTTPFHLASVMESGVSLPPCAQLLCATAPLPNELALGAESAFSAPVFEIYGCTESGQVASRRPVEHPAWQLLPGVQMDHTAEGATVHSGHVEGRVTLSDRIERLPDGRFLLGPRNADMVNIAGKRTSLSHLTAHLKAIDGVRDGCFFHAGEDEQPSPLHQARLAAAVVAPGLSAAELQAALRLRMDPVFLPRPLLRVDALPRNATGKLVLADLQALARKRIGDS